MIPKNIFVCLVYRDTEKSWTTFKKTLYIVSIIKKKEVMTLCQFVSIPYEKNT